MKNAIVTHNVVCMRSEPREGSSLESQAMMGDLVSVAEEVGDYARIRTADGYDGWSERCHLSEAPVENADTGGMLMVTSLLAAVYSEPKAEVIHHTLLSAGTYVHMDGAPHGAFQPVRLPDGMTGFIESAQLSPAPVRPNACGVARMALGFVGVPYLWGGTTGFGIDCSGLIQRAYQMCGFVLPRDAYLQAAWDGMEAVEPGDILSGDLLYFLGERDPRNRGITHVGMALGEGKMVHATGVPGVVVARHDVPPYASQLRCVRRPVAR